MTSPTRRVVATVVPGSAFGAAFAPSAIGGLAPPVQAWQAAMRAAAADARQPLGDQAFTAPGAVQPFGGSIAGQVAAVNQQAMNPAAVQAQAKARALMIAQEKAAFYRAAAPHGVTSPTVDAAWAAHAYQKFGIRPTPANASSFDPSQASPAAPTESSFSGNIGKTSYGVAPLNSSFGPVTAPAKVIRSPLDFLNPAAPPVTVASSNPAQFQTSADDQ